MSVLIILEKFCKFQSNVHNKFRPLLLSSFSIHTPHSFTHTLPLSPKPVSFSVFTPGVLLQCSAVAKQAVTVKTSIH